MMKLGIFGYGVVGGGVGRIVDKRDDMEVSKILVLPREADVDPRTVTDVNEIINDKSIDTVVEVMGGVHPSFEFVSAALKAGKNVVTANKALVSAYYNELLALANENNVVFRCTAAVGGGIPWLVNLARCRRADNITAIWGIMNGTTNYIMNAMTTRDVDFSDILKQAQELGYAEADPTADIDGWDIRRKLCISAGVAFDRFPAEEDVPMFGIRCVTAEDIKNFRSLDRVCKLVAFSEKTENDISAYLEPSLFTADTLEAAVPANFNIISYDAEYAGVQSFYGQGAGRFPTAYNVVSDLVDIVSGETGFYTENTVEANVNNAATVHPYYVRTACPDEYLKSITAQAHDGWFITKPVSVQEMHSWAASKKEADPTMFMAGIR